MAKDTIAAQLGEAGAALGAFARGPAQAAAEALSAAFEQSGERIARALGQAAVSGEDSFRRLAKTILEELAKIALSQILSAAPAPRSAPFSAPSASGNGPMTINFNLGPGADIDSIRRNQAQIAAQVARAAAYGSRNL